MKTIKKGERKKPVGETRARRRLGPESGVFSLCLVVVGDSGLRHCTEGEMRLAIEPEESTRNREVCGASVETR